MLHRGTASFLPMIPGLHLLSFPFLFSFAFSFSRLRPLSVSVSSIYASFLNLLLDFFRFHVPDELNRKLHSFRCGASNYAHFSLFCLLLLFLCPSSHGSTDASGNGVDNGLRCVKDACKMVVSEDEVVEPLTLKSSPLFFPTQVPIHAIRATCHPRSDLKFTLDHLCVQQLPLYTRVLEITNVSIPQLPNGTFSNLPHLRKLDIQGNGITRIDRDAFTGLPNLKRLDLSDNNLVSLGGNQFSGLTQLVRLKLGGNPLKFLKSDILDELPALKAIELSDTLLTCDCKLLWLLDHSFNDRSRSPSKRKPLRLLGSPTCQAPLLVRGFKLKKVSLSRLTCDETSVDPTRLEIDPIIDQVVFAGDSLRLQCKVSAKDDLANKVSWKWGQTHLLQESPKNPAEAPRPLHDTHFQYEDILVTSTVKDNNIISFVEIPEVSWGHSGEWSCTVQGTDHNNTRSISIYVIHHGTKYCPVNVTSGNKGFYSWPRTVATVTMELQCRGFVSLRQHTWPPASSALKVPPPQAKHSCSHDGVWSDLDTSECPFVSETTKILEHFANTNLSSTTTSLDESVRTLRNFTRTTVLKQPEDVAFLSKTILQYVDLLSDREEAHHTADMLVNVISSTLAMTKDLLRSSELLDRSCSRLVNSLWILSERVPSLSRILSPHIHVSQLAVEANSFSGVSCIWVRMSHLSTERRLKCNANNYSSLYTDDDEVLDAKIRVIPKLKINETFESDLGNVNITREHKMIYFHFFVYDSANLFPPPQENSWKVTSPVIGVRISGPNAPNVQNVYVTLRSPIYSNNIKPVWWNVGTRTSSGNWTVEGCKIVRVVNSLVSFRCDQLAHFGLLQDMAAIYGHRGMKGAPFKLSSSSVYVGSFICCLFLMASIATWSINHNHINSMSKNKHSFVNTWIAILFLVALFTVGIYQTETPVLCEVIGLTLHYFTTCVLLWITVSVTNLYKKVTKTLRPSIHSEDSHSDHNLPPKPMLRFYLVGWGIALILCGISAAVNLRQYSTYDYCFLSWNPSLAAFYAPSAALVFILTVFFVLTQCILRSSHGSYSEGTGNTETTELELLDSVSPNSENPPSVHGDDELSIASQTSSLSLLDGQHSPTTQLRAHAVTLLLFVLSWASAAIVTASPFASIIPFHMTIFSVVYAICSSSLGIFIFIFFCVSRSDVLEGWKDYIALCASPPKEDETQLTLANNANVRSSDGGQSQSNPTISNNQIIQPSPSPGIAPSVRSLESSNTHPTNKSSSLSHSMHVSNKAESLSKTSNALHVLNLSSLSNSVQYAPEMFYNPKQVGVAKRFFQKQRLKQMMKQNNLEMNRPDSDCNSSTVYRPRINRTINSESDVSSFDPSCLGLSNKVNNTNIHVDDSYMGKHSSKRLVPELLCVLGPPKDTCTIVSSRENDQHQWPVTFHFQCSPNTLRKQQKNHNTCQSVPEEASNSVCSIPQTKMEELPQFNLPKQSNQWERKSPVISQNSASYPQESKLCFKSHPKDFRKEKEHQRRHPSRGTKIHRPNRARRKRSHSREKEPNYFSEEEGLKAIKSNNKLEKLTAATGLSVPLSSESKRAQSLNRKVMSPASASRSQPQSPVSRVECHLDPSLPLKDLNYPPPCSEMEWLHLLNKGTLNDKSRFAKEDLFYCEKEYICCSEGDSTEGGGECDAWDNDFELSDWAGSGPIVMFNHDERCDLLGHHDGCLGFGQYGRNSDTSSIATSLIPGVDTSPPASLPVSVSPFDSPLHKFHQNTPDSLSLDSGSLLSPMKSQFVSCENAAAAASLNPTSPVGYHLTTCDTPVNSPACLISPTDTPIASIAPSISPSENIVNDEISRSNIEDVFSYNEYGGPMNESLSSTASEKNTIITKDKHEFKRPQCNPESPAAAGESHSMANTAEGGITILEGNIYSTGNTNNQDSLSSRETNV